MPCARSDRSTFREGGEDGRVVALDPISGAFGINNQQTFVGSVVVRVGFTEFLIVSQTPRVTITADFVISQSSRVYAAAFWYPTISQGLVEISVRAADVTPGFYPSCATFLCCQ